MSDNSPNYPAQQPSPGAPWPSVPVQPPSMSAPQVYPATQAPNLPGVTGSAQTTRGMYTAAAVLNWITLGFVILISFGIGAIAAAWFVPMTIQIHKGAKGPYKHTSLGVCTLLFCNIISGILMLANDSGRPSKPLT